ncbi:dynein axonemal heavy chain 12 isoform X3 [Neoarius graeffei]|uniref:dynein axonemal heavy chain 12 isoform X3 n=1 Tax=Neoarius graeffei TaxID=443677 RepID=UPI00298C8784|nr:dynein axonemal heavy chain 12 isoform X3 [Neoarius graeffei]
MDFETSGEIFDEDVAAQYMIEQSLLANTKQTEFKDILSADGCRIIQTSPERDKISSAIKRGDEAELRKLATPQSAFSEEDSTGQIPLHEAAMQNNQHILEITFKASTTDAKSRKTHQGKTALFLAVEKGLLENTCYLLDNGSSPDCLDNDEDSPLVTGADVHSQAQDWATILFEASASGNPDVISLLLEYGADANIPKHTGHLPIHRVAHRGHVKALAILIPVTTWDAVEESGMSPLHSAAAGGHSQCLEMLLNAGYDPNFMLHPWVRRNYDDQRRSVLYFAVTNEDVCSTKLLLEAGAMPNQDPVKCLQVALRLGNYQLIDTLLRYGANVNYFCRVNTTHFPSALQYALKDEVLLRMLFNYGYDVRRCFDCPYGDRAHVPDDYEGWSNTVIKDTMFCEVISVVWLKHLSGSVVRIMLDYVDHVRLCCKMKATLMEQKQWPEICKIQENVRCLQHLCRLTIRRCLGRLRLRAPVFMSFLPLPNRLKEYILYKEYDLYRQTC